MHLKHRVVRIDSGGSRISQWRQTNLKYKNKKHAMNSNVSKVFIYKNNVLQLFSKCFHSLKILQDHFNINITKFIFFYICNQIIIIQESPIQLR